MDIFRLPKFSYYFYRSQRDPNEGSETWTGGPMVFIASHWMPVSNPRVVIFSNCEEVELRLNGVSLGRQKPAKTSLTQYLPHPPFVFDLAVFSPGKLDATGFLNGNPVASYHLATPGEAAGLSVEIDTAGVAPAAGMPDIVIAHASVCDSTGNLCVENTATVAFLLEGDGAFIGPEKIVAEAGIASVVVRVSRACNAFKLLATLGGPRSLWRAEATWNRA
jgi:beta-galactosidase